MIMRGVEGRDRECSDHLPALPRLSVVATATLKSNAKLQPKQKQPLSHSNRKALLYLYIASFPIPEQTPSGNCRRDGHGRQHKLEEPLESLFKSNIQWLMGVRNILERLWQSWHQYWHNDLPATGKSGSFYHCVFLGSVFESSG